MQGSGTTRPLFWPLLAGSAIIIVILLAYLAEAAHQKSAPTTIVVATSTASNDLNPYYADTAAWQTYGDDAGGFSIAYPLDFMPDEPPSPAPSTDWWTAQDGSLGTKALTLTVPSAFEPQTNFVDATLTVGYSKNGQAIADCLAAPANGPEVASTTVPIDGVSFAVFQYSGIAAGNIYDTTSYSALHEGVCYAIDYVVHSGELGNYPASYDFTQFNEPDVDAVLTNVVGTFQFL